MGAVSRVPTRRRRRPTSLARLAGLVALGGMVGTTVRAELEAAFPTAAGGWPWPTFAINVVGSLVLGVLLESLLRTGSDTGWRRACRLGCGTGILGGFTTYSTFILEVEELLRGGHTAVAVAYPLVSVVMGVVVAGVGIALAAAWGRRRRAGQASA